MRDLFELKGNGHVIKIGIDNGEFVGEDSDGITYGHTSCCYALITSDENGYELTVIEKRE